MMRGPILRQLCVERNIETNKEDAWRRISQSFTPQLVVAVFVLPVHILSEVSKARLESFGS